MASNLYVFNYTKSPPMSQFTATFVKAAQEQGILYNMKFD